MLSAVRLVIVRPAMLSFVFVSRDLEFSFFGLFSFISVVDFHAKPRYNHSREQNSVS